MAPTIPNSTSSDGRQMRLGNVVPTLRLSLELCARYGRSPLWLSFNQGAAPVARRAFPQQLVEAGGWIVVSVELPVDKGEDPDGDLDL
jgi:hypothetical protein